VWSKKILPTTTAESELSEMKGISKAGHQKHSNGDIKMREINTGIKQKRQPAVQHDHSNGISRTTFIGDKNNPQTKRKTRKPQ
jgi:hypothetical protein